MIETTDSFAGALTAVYKQREAAGQLTSDDVRLIGHVIQHPMEADKRGRPYYSMRRLHAKVRTMYFREKGLPWSVNIDWATIKQWMIDHWSEILSACVSVLEILVIIVPFLG